MILLFLLFTYTLVHTNQADVRLSCEEDSIHKIERYSNYGKEVICMNLTFTNESVVNCQRKEIFCKNTIQLISVKGVLQKNALKIYPFMKTIVIYNSSINEYFLKLPFASSLIVINSEFPVITHHSLFNSRYIFDLQFHSNPGLQFEYGCFSKLLMLQNLTLYNQTLTTVTNNFFKGLHDLQILILVNNNLKHIETDAFQAVPKLKELTLEYNPIEHFNVNISCLNFLKKLSLLNTGLLKMHLHLFFPTRSLRILGLPNLAWQNANILELALTFPNLRTGLVTKNEAETEDDKKTFEALEGAALSIHKMEKSLEIKQLIYEDLIQE